MSVAQSQCNGQQHKLKAITMIGETSMSPLINTLMYTCGLLSELKAPMSCALIMIGGIKHVINGHEINNTS